MLSTYFPSGLLPLLFLVYAIFFFVYQKGKIQKWSFCIMMVICAWIFIDQHVFQSGFDNLYLTYILSYASCFFIISTFQFDDFRKKILRVVQWLSFFSIIIQLLYNSGFISAFYSKNADLTISAYIFNVGWGGGSRHRLSSIFWEPGQYQIVLNFLFILCSNDIIHLLKSRKIIILVKRYVVLVLALMLTISTTGYMVFAIICFYIALGSIDKRHIFRGIIGGTVMLAAIFALLQSDVVQEKFSEGSDTYGSYEVRLADNLGLLQMIQERPLTGYGIGTMKFKSRSYALDNATSSNGWLNAGAQLGVIFPIILILTSFFGIRRINHHFIGIIIFVAILMAQSNEAAYYLAPLNLFIFSYKNDQLKKYNVKKRI